MYITGKITSLEWQFIFKICKLKDLQNYHKKHKNTNVPNRKKNARPRERSEFEDKDYKIVLKYRKETNIYIYIVISGII